VGTVSVVGGLTGTFSANLFNLSGKVTVTIPGLSPFPSSPGGRQNRDGGPAPGPRA